MKHGGVISCVTGCFHQQGLGNWLELRARWMDPNTIPYENLFQSAREDHLPTGQSESLQGKQ